MLELLNLLMRFFTWGFATYRWWRKNEEFMLFLALGLWIDFLAAFSQRPILEALGLKPDLIALAPLMSMLAVVEAILMLAAALTVGKHLKERRGQLVILLSSIIGMSYTLAATILSRPPTVLFAFSIPFMGAALMLVGYSLIKEEIGLRSTATLLPLGALLLGAINLTYPATVSTSLAGYLYGLGALFRAMMFIGMARYAFLPIKPPEMPLTELPTGAFYTDSGRVLDVLIQKMQSSGNGILITRRSLKDFKPKFPVFWVTKVASGMMEENIMAVSPTDIGILIDLVKRYLEKGHSLVVIDCLEYLAMENGFENAFKFLLSLKDTTVKYNGTLVAVVEPSAYPTKHMAMLTRELEKLEL